MMTQTRAVPLILLLWLIWVLSIFYPAPRAHAQVFTNVPYVFSNGPTHPFIPSQMMADYASVINQGNGSVGNLQNELSSLAPFPQGSIVEFWLQNCPTGWTYVNLAGYYIRGLDMGRGLDTTGTGIAGGEASTVQFHNHSATGTWLDSYGSGAGVVCTSACSGLVPVITSLNFSGGTFFNSSSAGSGATSQPKSIYLLMCKKN